MLLVIDVGNMNITLGVFKKEELLGTFRMTTKLPRTSDEYGIMLKELVERQGILSRDINAVIIASVVPDIMHSLGSAMIKYFGIKPIIVSAGYYNRAYTLMRYPVTNIAHVITPVLHPILAEYQNDYEFIYDEFIKIIKIMSLLGVFITVFCFWADEEIILCYFGTQWMNAVSPFRWLSVCITFQLMNAVFGAIYQSLGKTKEMFHSGIIHISISLIAITAGAYSKNIIILAIFVSISMIVKFFIEVYFLIRRCFSYSILEFLKIFIPELIVGGIMFAVVFIVGDFANGNYWIKLFAKLCICIILYLGLLIITGQYKYLMLLKFKKQNTK